MASLKLSLRRKSILRATGPLCVLVFAWLASAQLSSAAIYYVAPNGSNSNNGSSAAPFKTIQKAADIVNPGDTVIIRDGIYTGNSEDVVELKRSGTASQWITFKAENLWGAVLDGQNFTTEVGFDMEPGVGYIRIEGLQVQNMIWNGMALGGDSHDVYYYRNLIHHIGRICTDTSGGLVGFSDKQTSVRTTYDSNVLYTIGRLHPSDGCSLTTTRYRNHDHGMYLRGQNLTIVNNVFYNFKSGWPIQSSEGARNWLISHNTFAFANPAREGHINLWETNSNITIANNVFYQPDRAAIYINPCGQKTNIVARNNISTGDMLHDSNNGRNSCGAFTLANNKVFTDPKLVNPAQQNFRLTSSSLAINQADPSFSASVDQEGAPRPQGGGYDMGAFEFGGQSTTDKTAPLVALESPAAGASVSGVVNISATASDNIGVTGVQFQLDGANLGSEDTTNSYSFSWDSKTASNGLHVLGAVARDAAGNTSTTALTVTVNNQAAAPTLSLTANPTSIEAGKSSTLSWSSSNATSCVASGAWSGNKNLSGQQPVQPSTNASYTLTCSGPGGSVQRTASVTVTQASGATLTLSLTATPSTIRLGQVVVLKWSSNSPDACQASRDWSGLKPPTGQLMVRPWRKSVYKLRCWGFGKRLDRTVTVRIQ